MFKRVWGNKTHFVLRVAAFGAAATMAFSPVPARMAAVSEAVGFETLAVEAAESYFKKPSRSYSSIVDALRSIGEDSSYSYRKQIAAANGIAGYTGSASQNTRMLQLLNQGKLRKPGSGNSESGGSNQYVNVKINLSVPVYRQYDSRWGGVKIGTKTIRQVGCLTTALAMLYSYDKGTRITPNKMIKKLSYSNNDVYWSSLTKLGYKVTNPYNRSADSGILKKIYEQLAKGNAVIVGAKNGSGQHWVIVVGYKGNRHNFAASDFAIIDPNNSGRTTLKQFFDYKRTVYRLVY